MQIKTVVAPSMAAALDRVREELGPDAVLMHTRMTGQGARRCVEITAALDPVAARTTPTSESGTIEGQAFHYLEGQLAGARRTVRRLQAGDPLREWLTRADFLPDVAEQLARGLTGHEEPLGSVGRLLSERIRTMPNFGPGSGTQKMPGRVPSGAGSE